MADVIQLATRKHPVNTVLGAGEVAIAEFVNPQLRASVLALPALDRAVVYWSFGIGCDQLPERRIADQLDNSITVTRRIKERALATLRRQLSKSEAA